ncbi:PP2C family protein-serine/threonine phosphatase [Kibdelosporangium persicum]|uniref:Two-component system response regulator n=1 Tax=Kibdelosporangium persicum TaxID=2698649 RepID=A0ABX2EYT1_9PSEU|nr:SpoIIE family protein phosphatase [Kibdelosporangium persicum]NRN64211.1 Two-component system response regulator [Kibdelosporangium persicum]
MSGLEQDAEDLYENAPCGYVSTLPDGTIIRINGTLLTWLGYTRDDLVGRRRFADLLTVGGRIYHETHYAPLLAMQGSISGIALELRAADGAKLPVLVSSTVKDTKVIRTVVFDARDRRTYEQELLRARRQAERLAGTLQQTLLPPSLADVPGLRIASHYHPASTDQVGGDFYDLFPLADDRWAFFLGDVSGKGAAAAVVTSLTRYTMRASAVHNPDPVAVLRDLNAVLNREYAGADRRFATVLTGLLVPDGDGFAVTMATGGHPPALLISADGSAEYQHIPGGQLVGPLRDAHFASIDLRLRPGDTLLLYTDGLTEARTAHGRYNEQALREYVLTRELTTAPALVEELTRLLAGFGEGLDDDTALLALSVPPA